MKTLCGLTFRWVVSVMVIVAVMDVVVATVGNSCGSWNPSCDDGEFCESKPGAPILCAKIKEENEVCYENKACLSGYCEKGSSTSGKCTTKDASAAAEQNGQGKRKGFPPILRNLKNALEKVKAKYNRGS